MKLTQSERESLGLIDYMDNHVTMTSDELKNIRSTLKLTQDGLAKLLDVTRFWVNRCETGKSEMSYAHAFILRLIMDLPEGKRQKWINVPKRKNRTREEVDAAIEDAIFTKDKKALQRFKDNGYEV